MWAALDVSQSMQRGDGLLWKEALDSLARVRPESTIWFGDSARTARSDARPLDSRSELRPAVDRAVAAGHPIVVVTDGELPDADADADLPSGSRLVVLPRRQRDAAIASFEAPRAIVSGDTVVARINVQAGSGGAGAGQLSLMTDGRAIATERFDELPPDGTRSIELRFQLSGPPGPVIVQAVASSAGDVVVRNDTLAMAIDRSRSASAIFVSTSPDFDSREALGILRGALALPARGYFRVAPGVWRIDGTLAPVNETDVRAAVREAPLAVFHGDTAVFGTPGQATPGPYALIVPVTDTSTEWYVKSTPVSPISPALAGISWDSLPPLLAAGVPPKGDWTAMNITAGRGADERALVAGTDTPRRTVTVVGSAMWRWQFRGGASADAFAAFWGGIFDWLAGERADKRAAIPDAAYFREGDAIRWRRGSPADSTVKLALRPIGGTRVDSLTLQFASGATVVETPALAEGIYEISVRGGSALLAVNPSSEWLPRAVRLKSGVIRQGNPAGSAPRLRDYSWIFALIVAALCAEWLIRRRIGLR
jgi:hypothetical protein